MKKDGTLDLRIKRTQNAIKDSFFKLIGEIGFEKISVKNLTEDAMISRNTFYLHYSDKYDLLKKICDEMIRNLFFRVGKQLRRVQKKDEALTFDDIAFIISMGLRAIDEDRKEYRILFSSSSCDILIERLSAVINRFLDLFTQPLGQIDDMSTQYIVNGLIGIIKYYILNDVDNIDEKCLAFAKLHMGKVIEYVNEKTKVKS